MKFTAGTCEFTLHEAKEIIAGYCFGKVEGSWSPPQPPFQYGELPQRPRYARWAYAAYDCSPRDPEAPVSHLDLVAPVLLNVTQGYGTGLVSRLLSVADDLTSTLARVDVQLNLWNLVESDISPAGEPSEGSPSWWLHRAWFLLESVEGCGTSITHKILHFKRPNQFPVVDSRTLAALPDGAWLHPYRDLTRFESEYAELETWFEEMAEKLQGVPLTRLRIHDILLWTKLDETDYAETRREGHVLLEQT